MSVNPTAASLILAQISDERTRQNAKWGEQNHPDGTGPDWSNTASHYRWVCQQKAAAGRCTWKDILLEEVWEAFAENDPAKIREELIQVAAVAAQWAEAIDRRAS